MVVCSYYISLALSLHVYFHSDNGTLSMHLAGISESKWTVVVGVLNWPSSCELLPQFMLCIKLWDWALPLLVQVFTDCIYWQPLMIKTPQFTFLDGLGQLFGFSHSAKLGPWIEIWGVVYGCHELFITEPSEMAGFIDIHTSKPWQPLSVSSIVSKL